MRLFLDAHVSARAIAGALREEGYDVRAAAEERALDGWEDEQLLGLAASEDRIMVTFNARDFARITGDWAASEREHGGCLIIVGIDHAEFGLVLRIVRAAVASRLDQGQWRGFTSWGTRAAEV